MIKYQIRFVFNNGNFEINCNNIDGLKLSVADIIKNMPISHLYAISGVLINFKNLNYIMPLIDGKPKPFDYSGGNSIEFLEEAEK